MSEQQTGGRMSAPPPEPPEPKHHETEVEKEFIRNIQMAEVLARANGASYGTMYGHLKLRCALLERCLIESATLMEVDNGKST